MAKALKSRASKQSYHSPQQLTLTGFESPFSQQLLSTNRWVVLAHSIPWDALVSTYKRSLGNHLTGAGNINPRVAIGAVIIKHLCDISDRETILQIQENMYMQYFIGYSSFSNEAPFDASVFVDIRKRLSLELVNEINEKILGLAGGSESKSENPPSPVDEGTADGQAPSQSPTAGPGETGNHDNLTAATEPMPQGSLLMDQRSARRTSLIRRI